MNKNEKQVDWKAYEEFKKKLKEQNLTSEEYERRIKEYCEQEGI